MKVAVTGASGFIGNALVRHLSHAEYEVRALVRRAEKGRPLEKQGLEVVVCDITVPKSLDEALKGIDVVIHLAAFFNRPEASWEEYRKVNVEGTKNILEASRRCGVNRVVHTSTVGVATGHGVPPFSEATPYSPPEWDKYETTKCQGEQIALEFYRTTGYPVTVLRLAQPYGPGDVSKAKFYRMVKKGVIVNPGRTLKHPVYIDDVCRAFELALTNDKIIGEPVIIAGKRAVPLKELTAVVAQELGVNPPKFVLPARPMTWLCAIIEYVCNLIGVKPILFRRSMDFFTKSVSFDVTKAQQLLGFEEKTELADGVRNTARWYQAQGML